VFVDLAVFVLAPGIWLFAYASFERLERKRRDVRIFLAAMATAAIAAVLAAFVDLLTSASGEVETALDVIAGAAMLLLVLPFAVPPLARAAHWLVRRHRAQ